MDEFERIRAWFAPLARSEGAAGLLDDVAELSGAAQGRLIITCDTLVEGVHFLGTDPVASLAAKLVRVNVSDILAKGGRPHEALLSLVWPKTRPPEEMEAFARALGAELGRAGAGLIGGDTTSTDGPMVLSLTLTGLTGPRGPVRRSGARADEDVWVTGCIGDGWLGLMAATGRLSVPEAALEALADRYRAPALPPAAAAGLVAAWASAACDVSDGLVADAGHIAEASGVEIELSWMDVPLSREARDWLACTPDAGMLPLLTGGDDYQILFTAPGEARGELAGQARRSGVRLTRIGRTLEGGGVRVIDASGAPLRIGRRGYRHF